MNYLAVADVKRKCVVGCGSPAVCAAGFCQKCMGEDDALDLAFARKLARRAYSEAAAMANEDVEQDPPKGWPHVPTAVLLTTVVVLGAWIVYEISSMFALALLDGWRPWE